jgi:hypothetical protein
MLDRGWETREVADGSYDILIAPQNPPAYTFCTGGFDEGVCQGYSTYTRIAANPPGPVSLSAYNDLPYRGLPVDSVTTVNVAGPNGEQLQQLQVNYRDEDAGFVTIHDRFSCYGHCPP